MNTKLTNKVVCITGASGDIGMACAELFADEGAILIYILFVTQKKLFLL